MLSGSESLDHLFCSFDEVVMGSELQRLVPSWSWEENKKFEVALAAVDETDPCRWEAVAAILGGKKSVEEVQEHYVVLLQDLEVIESGCLDYKLDEHGRRRSQSDGDQSLQIRFDVSCILEQRDPETIRLSSEECLEEHYGFQ